jgi:tRNA-2-methylthio-N6-dimethylallyladenosine synthase
MNERTSEGLVALLQDRGYVVVDDEHCAEVILLNTCSVRAQAEAKAIGKANLVCQRQSQRKLIGVLGCMAQRLGKALYQKSPSTRLIVGPNCIEKVPAYLDQLIAHPRERILDIQMRPMDRKLAAAHDENKFQPSAFVSIMQGCNMRCTYCVVPETRGPEQYRPIKDILQEIQRLSAHGTKEVTLLGQIVNHYGIGQMPFRDEKSPFVQLLEEIQGIAGIHRIHFMSPHPAEFRKDLIDAYSRLSKLCPHVHLPLQSGSDSILKAMKRSYNSAQFLSIVQALRQRVPTISISTDIIVGFPGETEEDFQMTCAMFDDIKFDMAFVFKYSMRPGTVAEQLGDQISQEIKDERNQILLEKVKQYSQAYNETMVGQVKEILVEHCAKRGQGQFEGRTPEHKKVIFAAEEALIGQLVQVKIERCATSTLFGKIVEISSHRQA